MRLNNNTNSMLNWRNINRDGFPTDGNIKYLVSDGNDISTTEAGISKNYGTGATKFVEWKGDDNTWEDNSCCSGTKVFGMTPTHWLPINELNLPT